MPSLISEPVLTLTFDNVHKLRGIDCENLLSMWTVFSKCKETLLNGERLENLSWRLWFRQSSTKRSSSPQITVEYGKELNLDLDPPTFSRNAPTTGDDRTTLNALCRQHSTSCLHDLASSNSSKLELATTYHDESDLDGPPETIGFVSDNAFEPTKLEDSASPLDVAVHDRKRKIFFIADSYEEEGSARSEVFDRLKSSRTVMDLQSLTQISGQNTPEDDGDLGSGSFANEDEDWESISSSYQSTLSTASSCVFEKIEVPKQTIHYEPSKPSLLSTLFQKCSSPSAPHSKPSLFKGLCTLGALDGNYEQDPLAKELSESLHQNVLWQRQQHEHFCRPCRRQQTFTKSEESLVASPGYYGLGW
ncbi:DUF1752-domain-containing protein [Basidiobolus meristosporus CBS 931.73]|uniref:DUF1752-domain-containing protein n=1 Tax=Basidiobolus meristosporus CBS 931.73 TaxID=1314790 RepID=A0A1Y1Y8Y5_9FUNG|nr:DUF1752-domain-containing protein [Basidiobolus meristosporus CBS 931.73]|eukprot:ORX94196.1 DUF1752-domain-containing protein [Basidiobolus meristosporus CBS 931.73]